MNFFQNLLARLRAFMAGRYGTDQLSVAILGAAMLLLLLALIPGAGFLSLASYALIVYSMVRTLSKNRGKRAAENAAFMRRYRQAETGVKQLRARFVGRKQYRYFRCPKCHALMRLPRGVGEVTVTCKQCGEKFEKKA